MQYGSVISASPSFTGRSSNTIADVAARVVREFRDENGDEYDDIFNFNDDDDDYDHSQFSGTEKLKENEEDGDTDDDEFEFAVVCGDANSADEIFSHGNILPRYPLFDRSLLLDVDPNFNKVVDGSAETDSKPSPVVRLPLIKLFSEERERESASCSSSEADDLDGAMPGTYCVWKPKAESPEKFKKRNSTGNTSRRWKFRDIIHRSNSDGKETPLLHFKPSIATSKKINNEKVKKVEKTAKVAAAATQENNPAKDEGNRRRSYLHGQDLADAFANVNGLSRNLHPFL